MCRCYLIRIDMTVYEASSTLRHYYIVQAKRACLL